MTVTAPTRAELELAGCWTAVDRVPHDPAMTTFKRTARLRQASWREVHGHPMGGQRIPATDGAPRIRNSGTRIPLDYATATGANFLSPAVRRSVERRLDSTERHQTLDAERLWCDLLSSMPLCFNLFGEAAVDLDHARNTFALGWPDLPGHIEEVRFEWSPGRRDRDYLNNRSAFDAAVLTRAADGSRGVLGIETKYHEHAKAEKVPMAHVDPRRDRLGRYREVTDRSGVFVGGALDKILGTDLQQLWLDHLLVLAMLQHPSDEWTWGRFVLVAPERNTSFAAAADRYRKLLVDESTFECRPIESLLDAGLLPAEVEAAFRERYLW